MDYDAAYVYVFDRLKTELPDNLFYHCPGHTMRVIKDTLIIAEKEGIAGHELLMVKTAALYHDTGFLYCYKANEPLGAILAAETLPKFGYTPKEVSDIREMILATAIPQRPPFHTAEILCDADLAYIGQGNYFPIADRLRKELSYQGMCFKDKEWLEFQLQFLKQHSFFTKSAIELYKEEKAKVVRELRGKLKEFGDET